MFDDAVAETLRGFEIGLDRSVLSTIVGLKASGLSEAEMKAAIAKARALFRERHGEEPVIRRDSPNAFEATPPTAEVSG